MSRGSRTRALVALATIGISTFVAFTTPARLGLDLKGGTQIVLEAQDSPTTKADRTATDRTVEVLRRRVDALGVSEPSLTRSGERRIIVELPGVQDPREAAAVIGRTAQLDIHPVAGLADPTAAATEPRPDGSRVLLDEAGQPLLLDAPRLNGDGVEGAEASPNQQGLGGWFVSIDFKGGGEQAWRDMTAAAACAPAGDATRRIAIVLDGEIISAPQVVQDVACGVGIVGGSTQITGSFTRTEAGELSALIRGGALPLPVEVIEQRTVGATLGEAAIEASAKAAVIGVALTGLFLLFTYRIVGAMATLALAGYALISYATLVALGATLTLPGLAGFVLAIGMAIDANVLVFERAREEYAARPGRGLRAAVDLGFRKAWSAILDSNVTTLLAAGLLFFLASGPVRGFGVTLAIGVVASMVSALVVTRSLVETALRRHLVTDRPGATGLATIGRTRAYLDRRRPDLLRHGRRWLLVSAAALLLAVGGIALRGIELGVEFTGGRLVEYATSSTVDVDVAREAVSEAGFPRAVVQESGTSGISVRTSTMTDDQAVLLQTVISEAGGGEVTKARDELIGPSLGDELRNKALVALGIALLAQLTYLAIRFRWTFAASTVSAMAHDVVLLVGIFAWLGKPLDGVFLAALLTVIGYSVNDSVVVFDRVRELWGQRRDTPFPQVLNSAVLQTVPRTINTGLGAAFILLSLAILGGDSLRDFSLALLIGIGVGTWSSMFTAGPLAMELEARSALPPPKPKRAPARPGHRPVRARTSRVMP